MAETLHGSPPTRRNKRGEEFQVVRRAGPVDIRGAPYVRAEAREDLLVIKDGAVFLCARPDGDVWPGQASGEGLYFEDTRFLSELRLSIGEKQPVLLSSSGESCYGATVDATNPELRVDDRIVAPQQTINVHRYMVVRSRLYLRLTLRNFGVEPVETEVGLALAADFADMFEVRGHKWRSVRGHSLAPKEKEGTTALAYVGEDEQFRETVIALDPPPERRTLDEHRMTATWPVSLAAGEAMTLDVTVEPRTDEHQPPPVGLDEAAAAAEREQAEWRSSCTQIEPENELFGRVIAASVRDMHALLTPSPRRPEELVMAAGIPWFVALFGRDSLLAAYESLTLRPELARDTLLALARYQADSEDPLRDAEPGKILHELRCGELAGAGLIPHTPYYGSVDATPLFLVVAGTYYRWTADLETIERLRPAMDAALRWIDTYGDRDGDGFVEYECRSPGGLRNQGWKDSEDCIVHADGSLAQGPIALVEVQGYVYLAKLRAADLYEALGECVLAARLRAEAATLKDAFNSAFWNEEDGFFALALDGRKRQVRSITSNPGHCLYCDIVDSSKAGAVAERLMADDMFSGWGVRTLSSESPAYNPMSYHNGSIWPHDNAILAAGLKRYGFNREMMRIATALFDVAGSARDFRLPELYCGFERRPAATAPVAYPVACIPQAWSAAAPFVVLQAMLGLSARAPNGTLIVHQPHLPDWLRMVELKRLRVGDELVSLAFRRDGERTTFTLLGQTGSAQVMMLS